MQIIAYSDFKFFQNPNFELQKLITLAIKFNMKFSIGEYFRLNLSVALFS